MEGGLREVIQFLSHHLTPLDFFLWEHKVYKTKIINIADLEERVEQRIKAIKQRDIGKCFSRFCKKTEI